MDYEFITLSGGDLMNSLVYQSYMRDEIIPKTVIFASAFGLTIDSFKTANEHGKYPYRIRFYHGNHIVGHMDLVVDEMFGKLYPGWEYPFILFTPVGNVSGHYLSSSNNNLFSYQLDLYDKDKVDFVRGLFQIYASGKNEVRNHNYFVGASVTSLKDGQEIADMTTNCCGSEVKFGIRSYEPFEEVTYGYFGDLYIYHRQIENREETLLTKISVSNSRVQKNDASLSFSDGRSYVLSKVGDTEGNIRFDLLDKEIMNHDSSFFAVIDRVRDNLTFPVYGGSISLYDRFASLSYQDNSQFLSISKASDVKQLKKVNPLVKQYCKK